MKITDILKFWSTIYFQVKVVEELIMDVSPSDILSPGISSRRIHGLNLKQYKMLCDSHGAND